MDRKLIVERTLPSGKRSLVYPFHFSIKGLESAVLCRDDEDYDAFVKYIFITALKCNVIVIIHIVVSNHAHVALLACGREDVDRYGIELKRVQSMWLNRKYGAMSILHGVNVSITAIDTVQYARNVLAYIPKNALDNGEGSVISYRWSGCRAMFSVNDRESGKSVSVQELSTRAIERIFHTGTNLSNQRWLLNERMELEPRSACDTQYLEMIFNHDQSFFLRLIGSVNEYDIRYDEAVKIIQMSDSDFMKTAEDYSAQWYGKSIQNLLPKQKASFLKYLGTKIYLSVPQVARCMNMERDLVRAVLNKE